MTTTPTAPLPPRPGEPVDPELRERYRTDASREREARRAEAAQQAAAAPPSRTPVGPIRVIALLVTVMLVLFAGLALVGPMLKQSATEERPLVASSQLSLKGEVGDLRVRTAEPGEEPRAVITRTWGLWEPRTSVTSNSDETVLTSSCRGPGGGSSCEVDWLVVVAPDTEVKISHGVGAVSLEGPTGDVDIDMGVGDVTITESEARSVRVDMGVGKFDHESVEPPESIIAHLGVGEAVIRVPDTETYDVDIPGGASETVNNIGSDSSSSRTISVQSGVGAVTIDPS